MLALVALAAAGLVAGLSASAPASAPTAVPPLGGAGDVRIEAGESVTYDGQAGRYHLAGGVVLRRGAVVLRARSADLDPETGEVNATGDVLLTDPTRVIAAEGVHAFLSGPFQAEKVVAFLKEGEVDLSTATSLQQARGLGKNRASFTGAKLDGDSTGGRFSLTDARLTLCDCAGGSPSWEIRTRSADVIPGERATLSWPVLYVTPRVIGVNRLVPVLAFPWLYLPLSDRQTGLLPTIFSSTGATGLVIAQPVFVTLGRSFDLTVTPEYAFGPNVTSGSTTEQAAVRGPGATVELRWAPAEGVDGAVELHGLHDLDAEPGGAGGDRLAIQGTHAQRIGDATRLRLDAKLVSDPVWFRDFNSDVLLRGATYARSDALLEHRWDAVVAEASAAYYEPLTPNGFDRSQAPAGRPQDAVTWSYGALGSGIDVFHRWPSLAATLLPEALGPATVSGRLGVARFAPATHVEASTGVGPGDPGYTRWFESTTSYALQPRYAATRADGRLELALPLRLGPVTLEPYARGAAAGYAFDAGAGIDPTLAAWAVGGARLTTELSRRYPGMTHVLAPSVEVRGGTDTAWRGGSDGAFPAYDPWDRVRTGTSPGDLALQRPLSAAPEGSFGQLRASVESRFEAGAAGQLRLELGQDYDLGRGRLAESFATAAGKRGLFSIDATARALVFDERPYPTPPWPHHSALDKLTELRATAAVQDARGAGVHASFLAVGPGASGSLMAGVDALFDLRPATLDPVAFTSAGARAMVLGGATIGYDALVYARTTTELTGCSVNSAPRTFDAGHVKQQTATFVWESPCHCFRIRALFRLDDCGRIGYSAGLDLSGLGEHVQVH